jgi:hypothetical protein
MRRPGTIPETMPRTTAQSDGGLARCIKDIEDAQLFRAASPAHAGAATQPIGHILDRLEQEFRATFTEQMQAESASH